MISARLNGFTGFGLFYVTFDRCLVWTLMIIDE